MLLANNGSTMSTTIPIIFFRNRKQCFQRSLDENKFSNGVAGTLADTLSTNMRKATNSTCKVLGHDSQTSKSVHVNAGQIVP